MTSGPASRRRVLVTLCLTQLIGWGVLYYAFSVFQHDIAAGTGWSPTRIAGAFTLGQVTAAFGGVLVGRLLDERGPRAVMTTGSVLALGSLSVVATAPSQLVFTLGWLGTGTAMAATLYGPAFAAITGWFGGDVRLRALATLTIVGGLASTVFAPLTAGLHQHLDWRQTYLTLTVVLATTVPLHWFGLRDRWTQPDRQRRRHQASQVVRSRAFLVLAAGLAVTGMCATAAVVNLVPLLREQGVGLQTAGFALALGGVGQVLGRLGHLRLATHLTPDTRLASVVGTLAVTTALLGLVATTYALVVVVLLAGAARGSLTLLRATAVTDRWGPRDYGRLSGTLALPVSLASAAGPWVGAQLAAWLGGYAASFLALAAVNALAVAAFLAARAPTREHPVNSPAVPPAPLEQDIDMCQH
jgi:MFS family permease